MTEVVSVASHSVREVKVKVGEVPESVEESEVREEEQAEGKRRHLSPDCCLAHRHNSSF